MRSTLSRWLLPIGLATASLVGTVSTVSAQPDVRDHRNRGPRADAGPREAPPPIREERVKPRGRGWVWVQGFWDWKNGRWEWTGGRWEKSRQGRRWRADNWELRGGVYVRVNGDWIDDRPNQAPPAVRVEKYDQRRGFVWVDGYWDWDNGQYVWVDGHYEKERRGKRWRQAKWELRDGAWVRNDGTWDEAPMYPSQAPPALRDERPGTKGGFVWIRGKWDWRDGQYAWVDGHWERERAKQRWNDGRWENRNSRWEWVEGSWGAGAPSCGAEPALSQPPPGDLKSETVRVGQGQFEVKGHYAWDRSSCNYVWTPGYAENLRNGSRYVPGNWNQGNGRWYYVEPRWEAVGGQPPPPPPGGGNPPPPPPSGPSQPPPAPREETYDKRAGFLWVRGHYEWRGSQYEWVAGHWERERAKQRWVDGRWELQGRVYVWIPGIWQ